MAKKKSKKKDSKKKDIKKKKLKKAVLKKKEAKKKDQKKKEGKKKKSKKKKNRANSASGILEKPKVLNSKSAEHSSNYNVKLAIEKLRTLKTISEIQAFTLGEKRITITKFIPSAISRLTK
jgi:hypothetical protein